MMHQMTRNGLHEKPQHGDEGDPRNSMQLFSRVVFHCRLRGQARYHQLQGNKQFYWPCSLACSIEKDSDLPQSLYNVGCCRDRHDDWCVGVWVIVCVLSFVYMCGVCMYVCTLLVMLACWCLAVPGKYDCQQCLQLDVASLM